MNSVHCLPKWNTEISPPGLLAPERSTWSARSKERKFTGNVFGKVTGGVFSLVRYWIPTFFSRILPVLPQCIPTLFFKCALCLYAFLKFRSSCILPAPKVPWNFHSRGTFAPWDFCCSGPLTCRNLHYLGKEAVGELFVPKFGHKVVKNQRQATDMCKCRSAYLSLSYRRYCHQMKTGQGGNGKLQRSSCHFIAVHMQHSVWATATSTTKQSTKCHIWCFRLCSKWPCLRPQRVPNISKFWNKNVSRYPNFAGVIASFS